MRTVLALLLLGGLPTAAGAHEIAREQQPFTTAAHRGTIAWSSYDPAVRAFRLKLWRGGTVTVPRIPPRGWPFDVDLGTDANGRLTAVYTRCRRQGNPPSHGEFGERRRRAVEQAGCDVWALDVEAGTERRLSGVSSPRRDERDPSLHRGRIAFVRAYGRRSRGLPRDIVYRASLDARGSRRAPMPPRGRVAAVASLGLGRRGLAYVYADEGFGFGRHTLYRVSGPRLVRLHRTSSGGANASAIVGPSLAGDDVYFAETNRGSGTGNRIHRVHLTGSGLRQARGSATFLSLAYLGGGRVVVSSGHEGCVRTRDVPVSESRCRLEIRGPFRWG